jgi:hypothetical protein
MTIDLDQAAANAMREEELLAEIEDFLSAFSALPRRVSDSPRWTHSFPKLQYFYGVLTT